MLDPTIHPFLHECWQRNKNQKQKDNLKEINEREAKILYSRYIYGKTQMELADDLGVSQAQISRIEKSAIRNVKRLMK